MKITDIYNLAGEEAIKQISVNFYNRLYKDEVETWLPAMFDGTPLDLAIFSQQRYFVQAFGGPWLYGAIEINPDTGMSVDDEFILGVHEMFKITPKGLERWMYHMKDALNETDLGPKGDEIRAFLQDWFWSFGSKMINTLNNDPEAPHNQKCPFAGHMKKSKEDKKN
eukprot:TRINITY_DN9419_c0_g1_i2.p1 TRINITY_DN9419_c0_g1~~TRINITY_DN9419_c0_g1_i2.p1  ORF type:complete len:167 (-),score=40.43 TRINITY_DN9419_c0_g1_i2:110-610(-)